MVRYPVLQHNQLLPHNWPRLCFQYGILIDLSYTTSLLLVVGLVFTFVFGFVLFFETRLGYLKFT